MSQTRKEIIAQLDAEAKARADQDAAHAAEIEKLQQALKAKDAEIGAMQVKLTEATGATAAAVAALEAAKAEHGKALAGVQEALTAAQAATVAEQQAHGATKGLVKLCKDALADPRYVDAALTALNGVTSLQAAADAEADRLQAAAQKPPENSDAQWLAHYQAASPGDRRRMWKERQAALKKTLDASAGADVDGQ
jgi:hypothetical protein